MYIISSIQKQKQFEAHKERDITLKIREKNAKILWCHQYDTAPF